MGWAAANTLPPLLPLCPESKYCLSSGFPHLDSYSLQPRVRHARSAACQGPPGQFTRIPPHPLCPALLGSERVGIGSPRASHYSPYGASVVGGGCSGDWNPLLFPCPYSTWQFPNLWSSSLPLPPLNPKSWVPTPPSCHSSLKLSDTCVWEPCQTLKSSSFLKEFQDPSPQSSQDGGVWGGCPQGREPPWKGHLAPGSWQARVPEGTQGNHLETTVPAPPGHSGKPTFSGR